ncbi:MULTISPECIES: IS4 family transposase [unclassified Streptomyces]|uniref:IS4 family transposase n=1 Tax=unclassified Streptomyces TaxID=2593676 RepID=UPI0036B8E937
MAGGVFAPGHLGGLTRYVPFDLVDAVLEQCRAVEQRRRMLPSRVGVYFLLALGLFPRVGYAGVWRKLTAGLGPVAGAGPSEKALRDLRRRIGTAPVKELFETLAVPLAGPDMPGACYRRWRTVAFDGCSSGKAPDSAANRSWLGKIFHRPGWAGYPTLMLMTLVETGTRGLLGAVFGPSGTGETTYAGRLLHLLDHRMLLLADRGFDGNDFLHAVGSTGAQFLVRVSAGRRPPLRAQLPDGSYLSRFAGLTVRIIEADITVTRADGRRVTGAYRLATSLLDHRTDPAGTLIRLYHERWEIESAYYALRHTLMNGRILRSTTPDGIAQELWATLALYQVLRHAMTETARSHPGLDPDRISFTVALETAREHLITAHAVITEETGPPHTFTHALLNNLLPPRRARLSTRKVKCPISRYHARKPDDRPLTSTSITAIDTTVHAPPADTKPIPPPPTPPAPTLTSRILTLLNTHPAQPWRVRDITHALHDAKPTSLRGQLRRLTHNGTLKTPTHGTYQLTHTNPLTEHKTP